MVPKDLAIYNCSTRCLLSRSSPQLLDTALRTIQVPVNQERVGVGADLGRDPEFRQSHQSGGQRLAETENPFQAGESDLYALPHPAPPLGRLGRQKDAHLGQGFPQFFAALGEIPEHRAGHLLPQSRLGQQLFGQADVRDIGRGELVGDGHPNWWPGAGGVSHRKPRRSPTLPMRLPPKSFPNPPTEKLGADAKLPAK
jgi:hypothetical protein